jgi:hypothetical protein
MASMARDAWTDERLDDLKTGIDDGFREMRVEFRAVRGEMKQDSIGLREEIRGVRAELGSEIGGVREEIGALNRSIHQMTAAMFGTMLVGFLGVIATIIAHG